MRRSHPIDAIISGVRQKTLAVLLLSPDRWWYLSDLARHLRIAPSSLQRELANLATASILKRRLEGKNTYYKADEACPFLPELQGLFIKTAGLADVLQDALAPYEKKIECAFLFGSIPRAKEQSLSDVDLMVVGDVRLSSLALPLRHAQEILKREVNPILFTPSEFRQRIKTKNHFLRNIISRGKIFIVGNEKDLERLVG